MKLLIPNQILTTHVAMLLFETEMGLTNIRKQLVKVGVYTALVELELERLKGNDKILDYGQVCVNAEILSVSVEIGKLGRLFWH